MLATHSAESRATPFNPHACPVLIPMSRLCFNRHGGARVHASTCGHAIHSDCRDAILSQALQVQEQRRDEPFWSAEALNGEVLCPLCKNISNAIVPLLPPRVVDMELGVAVEEEEETAVTGEGSPTATPRRPATLHDALTAATAQARGACAHGGSGEDEAPLLAQSALLCRGIVSS